MSGIPPGLTLGDPTSTAVVLAGLTTLFCLRVLGQYVVSSRSPAWLPPMSEWYSGLISYRRLLAIQLTITTLMWAVVVGVGIGLPGPSAPDPTIGTICLAIAWPYALAMIARYILRMWRHPDARWTGGTIPIVFHVVLATWLFVLGSYFRGVG